MNVLIKNMTLFRRFIFYIIGFYAILSCDTISSKESMHDLWYRSSGNDNSNKYININQINKKNINDLHIAWTFHSGVKDVSETTPIFTGKYLISASANYLFAINPINGTLAWKTKFNTSVAKRGLVFFNGLIWVSSLQGVYSIDPSSGKLKKRYGSKASYIPPVFSENHIIVGNYTSLESYDIGSGELIWTLSLDKENVQARLWSGMTFDKETESIFIVTSNSGYITDADFKNGGLANSVIAINVKSGKIIWQFQEIKHDLWDLDVVGQPILGSIEIDNKKISTVIAVTKSGNTLFLRAENGELIYGGQMIDIPKYHNQSKFASNQQLLIKKPTPFSSNYFDFKNDITNITSEKNEYVKFKLRHAKSNIFLPVSTQNDVVLFGLQGGAEWPGAAFDPTSKTLIIPSNHYPWILRASPYAKNEEKVIKITKTNVAYMAKCAICHGNDLKGGYLSENYSDLIFPSLVDTANRFDKDQFISLKNFRYHHQYINQIDKLKDLKPNSDGLEKIFDSINNNKTLTTSFFSNFLPENLKIRIIKKFPSLHKYFEQELIDFRNVNYEKIITSVTKRELAEVYDLLAIIKKEIMDKNDYEINAFWQLLLDQDGLPGSNPPYGSLNAINLNTGDLKWKVPFGTFISDKKKIKGDMNHGGVMITGSKIIFAGGTRDSYVRAFDLENGEEIWKKPIPAAASAPPMSYYFNGCQYVVYTATGGLFAGYQSKSDSTIAFKLDSCNEALH